MHLVTAYLAMRGQDRALAIMPTWVLFGVWAFAAGLVLTGRLQSDVIVNGLIAGLVLLVMLIGFTVTQFAFRTIEPLFGASPDDQQLRALAVDSTGAAIFEWNAKREEVRLGPWSSPRSASKAAGDPRAARRASSSACIRPTATASCRCSVASRTTARAWSNLQFRLRHVDNSYRWFELEGSGVATRERRMARCVGLVREMTDAKRALERLLHDAVHDSLTQPAQPQPVPRPARRRHRARATRTAGAARRLLHRSRSVQERQCAAWRHQSATAC